VAGSVVGGEAGLSTIVSRWSEERNLVRILAFQFAGNSRPTILGGVSGAILVVTDPQITPLGSEKGGQTLRHPPGTCDPGSADSPLAGVVALGPLLKI
jgi:hypothetical protein